MQDIAAEIEAGLDVESVRVVEDSVWVEVRDAVQIDVELAIEDNYDLDQLAILNTAQKKEVDYADWTNNVHIYE